MRLVCFPHAGGSASYFFSLSRTLGPDVEVLAVQYPGRQDRRREPVIDTIAELADRAHGALGGRLDVPFAFFGHSMGAVVAYEVARRIQRESGTGPTHLFASARRAPSRHRDGDVHLRHDEGLLAELRELGGTDERFLADPEVREAILGVTRGDYQAIETYSWTPGPPLTCAVTALVGDSDPHTSVDEADAWSEHTTGPFALRVFDGGHFYFGADPSGVTGAVSEALRPAEPVPHESGARREV
uniref:Putative type II thioesterase n=1 Tax=Streptomyces versipellis TaxID=67375 RepID=A0A0B6VLR5_9ACTN|nr:putative type II thioesterase [Streptomyces versipellis]